MSSDSGLRLFSEKLTRGGKNRHAITSLIAVAVLAFACISIIGTGIESNADDSGSCGNGLTFTYTESNHTLSIQKTGEGTGVLEFYSPSYRDWNSYCGEIQVITIGDGVTSIGKNALRDCSSIESIDIPSSVTSIGDLAFSGCTSLTSIDIPSSVTYIGSGAFSDCTSLVSIDIPSSVTEIGSGAFSDCTSLVSIDIPDSMTFIPTGAFEYCTSLVSINIPDSVTAIGWNVFSCTGFVSFDFPSSVTGIPSGTFEGCTSLVSINIPDSVTYIEHYAFRDCTSLVSIDIPDSVTAIGHVAFSGCTSLTSIDIPDSVTSILSDAFQDCTNLLQISLGNGLTQVDWGAFSSHIFYDTDETTILPQTADSLKGYTYEGQTIEKMIRQQSGVLHHITYDINGGSASAPVQADVAEGSTFTVASYSGTKSGYTFGGWSYNGMTYSPGSTLTMGTSDISFTAIWTQKPTHTVSYNVNGGSGSVPSQSVIEGETFTVASYSGTKSGYTFGGWSYGGNVYQPGSPITMGSSNITLTAVWNSTVAKHHVTYNANGGSASAPVQADVAEGSTFTVASYSGIRSGYTFGGWISDLDDQTYSPGTVMTMGKDDIGFTAKWVSNVKHTVSFDINGGSGQVPASFNVAENEKFVLPGYSGTKDGYVFLGWSLGDTYPTLKPGQEDVMKNADRRYVAQWNAESHVNSVSLNKTSLTLEEGESYELEATVLPDNALDKTVTWKSSNTNCVTVDNGKIKALKEGIATITVTTNDGGKTATCTVKVESSDIFKFDRSTVIIKVGQHDQLKLIGKNVEEAVFSTSSDGIISLDEQGKIRGLSAGWLVVSAELNGKKATCSVTVEANIFTPTLSEKNNITTIVNVDAVISFIDGLKDDLAPMIQLNLSKATEVTVPDAILSRLAMDPLSILEVANSHSSMQFSGELLSTLDLDKDLAFHLELVNVPSSHTALKPYLVIKVGLSADDGSMISSFSSPVSITFSYFDDHNPHYRSYVYYLPDSGSPVPIYGSSTVSNSICTYNFETNHFSTYALVLKNEKGEPVNPDDPSGGSGGMDFTMIAIAGGAVLAIVAIGAIVMSRRK